MHRQKTIVLLKNYNPPTSEEHVFKDMMLTFMNEHPGCFNRSETIGHITASSLLLNRDWTKTLLTHHKKLNLWLQLGGHCDGDPDPLSVAIKEAQEESGILDISPVFIDIFDLDVHLIPANSKEPAHYHYDIRFLLQVNCDEDNIVISDESNKLEWFDSKNCPSSSLAMHRLFSKWKAIQNHLTHGDNKTLSYTH